MNCSNYFIFILFYIYLFAIRRKFWLTYGLFFIYVIHCKYSSLNLK